jgi:hypothetical protein
MATGSMLRSFVVFLVIVACKHVVLSEQAANDDAAAQDYYNDNIQNNGDYSQGDDYIKYWTDYAILPKRCIV